MPSTFGGGGVLHLSLCLHLIICHFIHQGEPRGPALSRYGRVTRSPDTGPLSRQPDSLEDGTDSDEPRALQRASAATLPCFLPIPLQTTCVPRGSPEEDESARSGPSAVC